MMKHRSRVEQELLEEDKQPEYQENLLRNQDIDESSEISGLTFTDRLKM